MYIYKVADDYDFLYWGTPLSELEQIESVSDRRAHEWAMELEDKEKFKLAEVSSVIPAQFFAALSLQVTQSIHILITEHGFDFDRLSGIYIQRINEIEAGTDISFVVGISSGLGNYVVCRYDRTGRLHPSIKAELIGSHLDASEPIKETIH